MCVQHVDRCHLYVSVQADQLQKFFEQVFFQSQQFLFLHFFFPFLIFLFQLPFLLFLISFLLFQLAFLLRNLRRKRGCLSRRVLRNAAG